MRATTTHYCAPAACLLWATVWTTATWPTALARAATAQTAGTSAAAAAIVAGGATYSPAVGRPPSERDWSRTDLDLSTADNVPPLARKKGPLSWTPRFEGEPFPPPPALDDAADSANVVDAEAGGAGAGDAVHQAVASARKPWLSGCHWLSVAVPAGAECATAVIGVPVFRGSSVGKKAALYRGFAAADSASEVTRDRPTRFSFSMVFADHVRDDADLTQENNLIRG